MEDRLSSPQAFQPPQAQELTVMVTAETQEECGWSNAGANRADLSIRGRPQVESQ